MKLYFLFMYSCMQRSTYISLYHDLITYMSIDCIWLNSASFLRRRRWSSSSKHSFVYQNEMHEEKKCDTKNSKARPTCVMRWRHVRQTAQKDRFHDVEWDPSNAQMVSKKGSMSRAWCMVSLYHVGIRLNALLDAPFLAALWCCWRFFFFVLTNDEDKSQDKVILCGVQRSQYRV